jgi:PIN domain nuclease of toxin-antitoxin system
MVAGVYFDRMLAAQAQVENLSIVSADKYFDRCDAPRVW